MLIIDSTERTVNSDVEINIISDLVVSEEVVCYRLSSKVSTPNIALIRVACIVYPGSGKNRPIASLNGNTVAQICGTIYAALVGVFVYNCI